MGVAPCSSREEFGRREPTTIRREPALKFYGYSSLHKSECGWADKEL